MPTINSFIRFLHVSPNTTNVDIYCDEEILAKDLAYNKISDYTPTGPEDKRIQIFATSESEQLLLDTTVSVLPSEKITYAIIGTLPEISLLPIFLKVEPIENPEVLVRFANLSSNVPNLDVVFLENESFFTNVGYSEVTNYETILPDTYYVKLKPTDAKEIIFTSEAIELESGYAYTIYTLGLLGDTPALDVDYYYDQIPLLKAETSNNETWKTEKVISPSSNTSPKIIFTYY
ncbi:MAG: DUF4397 domain-containing protein [Syntrophomonadaceae bacterium]|nr:DUF4397 domain-containing protein [Syntrophomonadaceae bacterium]